MTTHDWASRQAHESIGASLPELLADLHRASDRIAQYHTAFNTALIAYECGAPPPYTVKEAADALGVGETTVREMTYDGRLQRIPDLGTTIRIPRASVSRLLSS